MALGFRGPPAPQPDKPPTPIAVQFGTDADNEAWKRLLFAKYLLATNRLDTGKQDR